MNKTLFCDSWNYEGRVLTLPHDAMLEAGREADSPTGSAGGFFKGGVYEYTKTFKAPAEWKKKHLELEFEGVYQKAKVYLNDEEIGGAEYGYIPFFVTLDEHLNYGKDNILRVTVDNSAQPCSRWYTGGGIYRPVWLWEGEKEYIAPEGIKIDTLSYNPARVCVKTDSVVEPTVEIWDGEKCLAKGAGNQVELEAPGAQPWDEENPKLYTCKVSLKNGETAETRFGIRKVEWNPQGLYINGKSVLLRGGCVHHDNGILGACAYPEAEYRRVKKLKDAGYNAIRSAHNPCSKAMLEACDELGVYLMDESWDMWFHHKSAYDYATVWRHHYLADLKAMVDRDYNHPSVIFYSIGNEVSEPGKPEGVAKTKEMVAYLHSLDNSRAVTGGMNLMIIVNGAKGKGIYDEENGGRKDDNSGKLQGMNSTMFNMITSVVGTGMNGAANSKQADLLTTECMDALDISGYNYASGRYPLEGKAHPNRVVFGSETFPQDIAKNWEMIKKYPYLVGDFMWTAWDYLGEAGIGAWAYTDDGKAFDKPYPWLLADVGAFDLIGTSGAPVAHAKAAWEKDEKPWIGVQPVNHNNKMPAKGTWRGTNAIASWSFAGCDGNKAVVEVYSSAAKVEVFLNGKSLGKKALKECKATYKTKYAFGTLKVVAYAVDGTITGENELVSANANLVLNLVDEKINDLHFVEVTVADENGVVESNADVTLAASVEGGELLGFGSANPRTEENFLSGTYTTYYGRALAVVRTNGKAAKLTVSGAIGSKTIELK